MELLTTFKEAVSAHSAGYLPFFQEKGQNVLDLVKAHPWTSLGAATGTVLLWSYVRPRNLPPGPLNYPILGAPSCYETDGLEAKMLEWRPKYGEIVSFYKFGQLCIVLNSERVIREAFVKKQEQFSHRPKDSMIPGLKDDIFSAPYNETWKKNKKFAISSLKTYGFGTPKSEDKIHEQVDQLEEFLMKSSGTALDIAEEFKSLCAATISSIVLGAGSSWDDPETTELVHLTWEWFGGLFSVLTLPLQQLFPNLAGIIGWKRVNGFLKVQKELIDYLAGRISERKNGLWEREPACVSDAYLRERGTDSEVISIMAQTIMTFLADAIDTSGQIDHWLLFFVTYYPEVQKKIQKEVDSVCGQSRKVTLADRPNMPYTQAVIHETLRHVNLLPMSLPRVLMEDVELDGYTLPRGARVVANFYAVHYDPKVFPNPEKFDPTHFLHDDGSFNNAKASSLMSFNLGSRKCIGEPFFKVVSFLLLSRMLQRFEFEFDPSSPRPSTKKDTSTLVGKPSSFKVVCKPR